MLSTVTELYYNNYARVIYENEESMYGNFVWAASFALNAHNIQKTLRSHYFFERIQQ